MTRWKKDAKEFDMALSSSKNKDGSESLSCRIPKILVESLVESLGNPNSLRFKLRKNNIIVEAGEK